VPWWVGLPIGVACVCVGGVLTADPFRSLSVLDWLVAAGLIVAGAGELAWATGSRSPWLARAAGLVWLAGGVLAAAWRGISLEPLAAVVGAALIAGGIARLGSAVAHAGEERLVLALGGLTSGIVGVLALAWPEATVLVLAIVFGLAIFVFGVGQIVLAVRRGRELRWPRPLRLAGAAAGLVLALAGVAASAVVHGSSPARPGPFYAAPAPLPPGPPGTIVRSEELDGYHAGATTYRVLYKSTGFDKRPTAVSGLVLVPRGIVPPKGIVAYAHGTVGVAPNCAPSLAKPSVNPLFFEGGAALLAAGFAIAAPDYQGLGTAGPHPYLVGESEARDTLDAVRAARRLTGLGPRFAVWGHSQGGQASLFTGQLARTYARELKLVAVAAGAPASNLVELFKINVTTLIGKVLVSMALDSWSKVYSAPLSEILSRSARPLVRKIARSCLYDQAQILAAVPSALLLKLSFLRQPPWQVEPWKSIVAQNTPGAARIPVPVLVTQGGADRIIPPGVQAAFVGRLCDEGDRVDFRTLPGVGHLEGGHEAAPQVERWLADRFAGKRAATTCPQP